jgi:endonuclease-3
MLSAQCKDERVNQVTKELFSLAPDALKMVQLDQKKIAQIIHPCGLYENKSKNLKGIAEKIVDNFNNIVPKTMDELTTLPGIGRKSANVVLGNAFNIPGFPVDTHVNRVLNKLGAVKSTNPEVIEEIVCSNIEDIYWTNFSHLLITFGRQICHARGPKCGDCPLKDICKFYKG